MKSCAVIAAIICCLLSAPAIAQDAPIIKIWTIEEDFGSVTLPDRLGGRESVVVRYPAAWRVTIVDGVLPDEDGHIPFEYVEVDGWLRVTFDDQSQFDVLIGRTLRVIAPTAGTQVVERYYPDP